LVKLIFLTFFLILTLEARQNPFFPTDGEVDILTTSNIKNTPPPLKRAAITIPSEARAIKKVTVEFVNLDGSTQKSSIELNNAVDWYLPIFISQSMGEINTKKTTKAKTKKAKTPKKKYTQLYNLGFITFYKKDKEFKIATQDKMIRDFLLTKPHRIVMDFKRDIDIKSRVKILNTKYYKMIRFGVHKDYYRVVLELDGIYKYTKEKKKKGYSLFLH